MKMQALKGFAVAAFIVLLGASSANASSTMLRAEIPFDFMAGNVTLHAGTYTVTEPVHGVLLVRNENLGPDAAFVLANSEKITKPQDKGKLIFRQYGNRYFLNQVWTEDAISEPVQAQTHARDAPSSVASPPVQPPVEHAATAKSYAKHSKRA